MTLDQFELLRVIGRGSYAKVLMVEQKRTKRVYAMKVIKKELVNEDEVGTKCSIYTLLITLYLSYFLFAIKLGGFIF